MVSNDCSYTAKIRNPEWLDIYLKLKEEKSSSQIANEKRNKRD